MQSTAKTIDEYLNGLPAERIKPVQQLHAIILKNLPKGFTATMNYGMIGYVVPHTLYPNGYHCDPKLPLPFAGLASQKNAISFYHMGLYADTELMNWFVNEYPKHCNTKLDMGKSCIRFKKPDQIPYELISELMRKVSVKDWIMLYEKQLKK